MTSHTYPLRCTGISACLTKVVSDTPYLILGGAWKQQDKHFPNPKEPEDFLEFTGAMELLYHSGLELGNSRLYEAIAQLVDERRLEYYISRDDRRMRIYKLTHEGYLCYPCWREKMLKRIED